MLRTAITRGSHLRTIKKVHAIRCHPRHLVEFVAGKLVLTGLDTKDGFSIIFDPASLTENELTGRIPKASGKAIRSF